MASYTGQGMHFELRLRQQLQGSRRSAAAARTALAVLQAVLLLGALAVQAPPVHAQADEASPVREARDSVLADGRYQTERPQPQEPPPDIEPFTIPDWLAEALYWSILIGVGALVLFFIGNLALDLWRSRSGLQPNRDRAGPRTERVETAPLEGRRVDSATLAEADRLAAEGRFSEAIHLLLLVAMARLHHELGPRVAPALTGREVLRLSALPPATVEPLTRMVQLSEINHFGGRAAAEPDYRRARDDFLRFNGEPAPA